MVYVENGGSNSLSGSASGSSGLPEARFKAGPVTATVWKNERQMDNKQFAYFSVSLDRTYKDKQGSWQRTTNLRVNDLPRASLVLGKAYEYLSMKAEGAS